MTPKALPSQGNMEIPFDDGDDYTEKNYGDIVIDSYQRDVSNYKVEDLDKILDYLDPAEMNNYDDLLTLYASYLPLSSTQEDSDLFYDKNYKYIGQILGIYDRNEFIELNKRLINSNITPESKVDCIRLDNLEPTRSLLKASVTFFYDTGEVCVDNYINYVYMGNQSFLFLYSDGVVE